MQVEMLQAGNSVTVGEMRERCQKKLVDFPAVLTSDRRPLNPKSFHSRLQSSSLESEAFGCTVFSTDFPSALLQYTYDVCTLNVFQVLALSLVGPGGITRGSDVL